MANKPKGETIRSRVLATLRTRGVNLPSTASIAMIAKTVTGFTGKTYVGDTNQIWRQLAEFCDGPLTSGLAVRTYKPWKPGRYDAVLDEIARRRQ